MVNECQLYRECQLYSECQLYRYSGMESGGLNISPGPSVSVPGARARSVAGSRVFSQAKRPRAGRRQKFRPHNPGGGTLRAGSTGSRFDRRAPV